MIVSESLYISLPAHGMSVAIVCFSGVLLCLILLLFNKFIYLFMDALGLCCCTRAFFSCSKWGLLFVVVRGLLVVVVSLCFGARALGVRASVVVARGLSSCGSWALEHRLSSCGTWA